MTLFNYHITWSRVSRKPLSYSSSSLCLPKRVWETLEKGAAVMRGPYKYKTYKCDKRLKKNKFIHCGDMIRQSCGFIRPKKTLCCWHHGVCKPISGNGLEKMCTRAHKHAHRRCWKVICESHVTLSTREIKPFSALSSPQMMSHLLLLLLQHGDDLTDSAGHRQMTSVMTWSCNCLICNVIINNHSLFFNLKTALINRHNIHKERDEGVYFCMCVWVCGSGSCNQSWV